jgi:UDP-N-acetylmuramate--alanine ligase
MIRIGIFFGGPSREREISFAGGRTVYDNLDKSLFEPVPIFVDSRQNFVLLDWQYLYKGTIRDFFPPVEFRPASPNGLTVYRESLGEMDETDENEMISRVGRRVPLAELPALMDVAFLALHGLFGEDGQIQGLLESLQIPYTGSGIRACSIGMDKGFQKKMMEAGGFLTPKMHVFNREEWCSDNESGDGSDWYEELVSAIGLPLVVRPANQGSSIGVSIVRENDGLALVEAVNAAFFIQVLERETYLSWTAEERIQWLRELTDIRTGIGFPLKLMDRPAVFDHPEELLAFLEVHFQHEDNAIATLEGLNAEQTVIVEEFLDGREFSCIVLRNEDNSPVALPPTEIVKGGEVFDYRSKYLAGLSRKETPIRLPADQIEAIRRECERLFDFFGFACYARIDGFIKADGSIFLNDPNTTSGMLPSSFFFHQAAEIGLSPSKFLTYIVRTSLMERIRESPRLGLYDGLLAELDREINAQRLRQGRKKKVAVILGGYSSERHISVESGRNIFEKLSSSDRYEPIPVFLTGSPVGHRLFQLPINLLLKDNADDIRDKVLDHKKHPLIEKIKRQCQGITAKYASKHTVFEPKETSYEQLDKEVDAVFIALHGRPGEDGGVQRRLEALGIPYNGSSSGSSAVTINKYETLQRLKQAGFPVTDQLLLFRADFERNSDAEIERIERALPYPLIAKPVDDGCSSAVKLVRTRYQLSAWLKALFREAEDVPEELLQTLRLKPKEEFPRKEVALLERLIAKENAVHFLEITGGLLTRLLPNGEIAYEVFEPSEALASGEVLSLEEKFLAGEGQNLTPARFSPKKDLAEHERISAQVRKTLEEVARTLQVTGYARIDAFVRIFADGRVETIVVEVNSLPGMTPATCIFHQTALNGYKPYDFIDKILDYGMARARTASGAKS